MPTRDALRREAVLEAETVLAEYDVLPGRRVPIFDIIEEMGIWLCFAPLRSLFGVYERVGATAGIALHRGLPRPVQRFTAAHELGHHVLGHDGSMDNRVAIEGKASDPREIQAQTFAASVLVSELAVEDLLERRGHDLRRPRLAAVDVYALSVELGVSYRAMLTQLEALGKIGSADANEFRRASPLALKTELLGRRPENARAGVWRLDLDDNGRHLVADVGDEFQVALPEDPSSSNDWSLEPSVLHQFAVTGDCTALPLRNAEGLAGAFGFRRISLRLVEAGAHPLTLRRSSPRLDGLREQFSVTIVGEAPRVPQLGRGISANQQCQLLSGSPRDLAAGTAEHSCVRSETATE